MFHTATLLTLITAMQAPPAAPPQQLCVCGRADHTSALHIAAQRGDDARIRRLLAGDPALADKLDAHGYAALHWAALHVKPTTAEVLLSSGARPDVRSDGGETPLHLAARQLNKAMVDVLSADKRARLAVDAKGQTAIHVAVLSNAQTKRAKSKRLAIINLLMSKGLDVNLRDAMGATALHAAATVGRLEVMPALAKGGAVVDARDASGSTPLHRAARTNHVKVVDWLIEQGAVIDAVDAEGNTPLHVAAHLFRVPVAGRLVALKAKVDARNHAGQTPLHALAGQTLREPEVEPMLLALAKVLVAGGAAVDAKDRSGQTAAQLATSHKHEALAKYLTAQCRKQAPSAAHPQP